jgi:hypothetical protein
MVKSNFENGVSRFAMINKLRYFEIKKNLS